MFKNYEPDPSVEAPEDEDMEKGFEGWEDFGNWSRGEKVGAILALVIILAIGLYIIPVYCLETFHQILD